MAAKTNMKAPSSSCQNLIKVLDLQGKLVNDSRRPVVEAVFAQMPEETLQKLSEVYQKNQLKGLATKIKNS